MYDLIGNPITMSLGLVAALITLRLGLESSTQLYQIALNFVRKAGRK
jgi:hypothetical protein